MVERYDYSDFPTTGVTPPCKHWWVRYAEYCTLKKVEPKTCPYKDNDQRNCPFYEKE